MKMNITCGVPCNRNENEYHLWTVECHIWVVTIYSAKIYSHYEFVSYGLLLDFKNSVEEP